MKLNKRLRVPFETAQCIRLDDVRYLQWLDAFQIDFEDGLSFLEPHASIRETNGIAKDASVRRVSLERELRHGFHILYSNGQTADVSWAFIRELEPDAIKGVSRQVLVKVAAALTALALGGTTVQRSRGQAAPASVEKIIEEAPSLAATLGLIGALYQGGNKSQDPQKTGAPTEKDKKGNPPEIRAKGGAKAPPAKSAPAPAPNKAPMRPQQNPPRPIIGRALPESLLMGNPRRIRKVERLVEG